MRAGIAHKTRQKRIIRQAVERSRNGLHKNNVDNREHSTLGQQHESHRAGYQRRSRHDSGHHRDDLSCRRILRDIQLQFQSERNIRWYMDSRKGWTGPRICRQRLSSIRRSLEPVRRWKQGCDHSVSQPYYPGSVWNSSEQRSTYAYHQRKLSKRRRTHTYGK